MSATVTSPTGFSASYRTLLTWVAHRLVLETITPIQLRPCACDGLFCQILRNLHWTGLVGPLPVAHLSDAMHRGGFGCRRHPSESCAFSPWGLGSDRGPAGAPYPVRLRVGPEYSWGLCPDPDGSKWTTSQLICCYSLCSSVLSNLNIFDYNSN